jgi:hypothetical protein
MKKLLILIALYIPFLGYSQSDSSEMFAGWDAATLKMANTVKSASYLTDEEKSLVIYTNLCRIKPQLFRNTILENYLVRHNIKSSGFVSSLKKYLENAKSLEPLEPDEEIFKLASAYAVKMGKEGTRGHAGFKERMKPVLYRYHAVGENCDYGHSNGLDCLISLLIDNGNPDYGHRKNIMNSSFSAVGVSIKPHKSFKTDCVMDFAGG